MERQYIPISHLKVATLKLLDKYISQKKSFDDIWCLLADRGYMFRGVRTNCGRLSKCKFTLEHYDKQLKRVSSSFVDIVKTRNGQARSRKQLYLD